MAYRVEGDCLHIQEGDEALEDAILVAATSGMSLVLHPKVPLTMSEKDALASYLENQGIPHNFCRLQ